MVSLSRPPASASARPRSTTACLLSRVRSASGACVPVISVDNYTPYMPRCTAYMYNVYEQRTCTRYRNRLLRRWRLQMPRRWWTLVAVSLATFMTYLDNNIVNVAIPTIQRSLHLSVAGLEWVVSGYVLVFAGLMLVGGRLADVYGRRRVFLTGLSVFTLSSLAPGLASTGGMLIAFRAVQGLGAALLVPTTLAIIIATFDDVRERTRAIGIWTAISALALAFGPLIGGFISQNFHWGWIFFINVPVGVITFAMTVAWMAESHGR